MAADIIARGLALGMSGDVEDVKEKIGKIEEELEGKESLILASTKQEMEALCTAENEGKYVKYVGPEKDVENTLIYEDPYIMEFDSDAFLEKIDHQVFKKKLIFDGFNWMADGEDYTLSDYGISIFKGTSPFLPIGQPSKLYVDMEYYPSEEEIEAAVAAGGVLIKNFTGQEGGIYYNVAFATEYKPYASSDPIEGHFILLQIADPTGEAYSQRAVYTVDAEGGRWDDYYVQQFVYILSAYGFTIVEGNNDVYATCAHYLSPYAFPHAPYVPEESLDKHAGDSIIIENVKTGAIFPGVGEFGGHLYLYNNGNMGEYLQQLHFEYDPFIDKTVCIIYKGIGSQQDVTYIMAISSSSELYMGYYTDGGERFVERISSWDSLPIGFYDIMNNRAVSLYGFVPTHLTVVNEIDKTVLQHMISCVPAVGDQIIDMPSATITFVPPLDIMIDKDVLTQKVGTDSQTLVFRYLNNTWVWGDGINTNPFEMSDIGTTIDEIYFNKYLSNIDDLLSPYQSSNLRISTVNNNWEVRMGYEYNIAFIVDSESSTQIYASNDLNVGLIISFTKGWRNIDNTGKYLNFPGGQIQEITEAGLLTFERIVSKSAFVYEHVDLAEYGVTINGIPEDGMELHIVIGPTGYNSYRSYTVVSVGDGVNYEMSKTYLAPQDDIQVAYTNVAGENQGLLHFVKCSRAEYDSIIKDANTLYFIMD